jgi:hypothetical protein
MKISIHIWIQVPQAKKTQRMCGQFMCSGKVCLWLWDHMWLQKIIESWICRCIRNWLFVILMTKKGASDLGCMYWNLAIADLQAPQVPSSPWNLSTWFGQRPPGREASTTRVDKQILANSDTPVSSNSCSKFKQSSAVVNYRRPSPMRFSRLTEAGNWWNGYPYNNAQPWLTHIFCISTARLGGGTDEALDMSPLRMLRMIRFARFARIVRVGRVFNMVRSPGHPLGPAEFAIRFLMCILFHQTYIS